MSGSPGPAAGRWPTASDEPASREAPEEAGSGIHAWGQRSGAADRSAMAGAPGESDPAAADDAEAAILSDVAALAAERDEYLSSLQRLKADFDNYRKRVARLQEEQAGRAAGDVVMKLLPIIDNLDLAWAHLGGGRPAAEVSEEARAIAQARQQLLDVLAREGLERVDAAHVPFDPTVHDAVAHLPAGEGSPTGQPWPGDPSAPVSQQAPGSDGDDEVGAGRGPAGAMVEAGSAHSGGVSVDEVMRAGYRWRGQVLRPAMVRVRG